MAGADPATGGSSDPATGMETGGAPGGETPGGTSAQTIAFMKDGVPVAVDFRKWGTPSYYQKTPAGWRLAVVANEVVGSEGRYFSLGVRALDNAELAPGTYSCTPSAAGPPVIGEITYSEAGMERVWKEDAAAACSITITAIGAIGGHLTGTFSATLKDKKGVSPDVVLSSGVFDVVRKQYGKQ
jgi:hypothetical protein